MAWWGTLVGGTLGFVFGGPIGAMIGAALGGNFDRGINMGGQFDTGNQERVQAAFFTTTFSVMGHVAKADGHVSPQEIATAKNIMAQMQLSAQQQKAAVQFFDQGKADDFPLEDLLHQFKKECHGRRNLIQMFVEIQIATALADGKVDANEKRVLYTIGEILGFSRSQIDHLFNMANAQEASSSDSLTLTQAYKILGVKKDSSEVEVKKAYRRLMSQHHPDKLVAKGLPDEMIQLATEKTQEIRKAYDLIKKNL
ncbi:DnaJ-like protein DjlA [hydrothermal vent metagenome]|uniref:DnaJ-like protein DjlA n=1 Tax=hydrothermal vent metagenome TaxID=652676 RepID=A0A3B0X2P4_9ZZZZ